MSLGMACCITAQIQCIGNRISVECSVGLAMINGHTPFYWLLLDEITYRAPEASTRYARRPVLNMLIACLSISSLVFDLTGRPLISNLAQSMCTVRIQLYFNSFLSSSARPTVTCCVNSVKRACAFAAASGPWKHGKRLSDIQALPWIFGIASYKLLNVCNPIFQPFHLPRKSSLLNFGARLQSATPMIPGLFLQ
eukprot:Blabericola_migrator_1__1689@NODE_1455_length_4516_cov_9_046527_g961_i0_p2_GENE_NODE_1455_length_4516_cov_9_046527_g961_i0NODE_1455_length_4516_cov_9_046527_g961_i0_p2_ORF_typecomplete_len195_score13_14_NODE_1455_length_4516_cov_9_046527_g961_i011751759